MTGQTFSGASEDIQIIERFTRVDADTIDYRFTVEDPKTRARPWSAEVPFESRRAISLMFSTHGFAKTDCSDTLLADF